jgi:neutral trehalase
MLFAETTAARVWWMKTKLARVTFKFLRTARYLTELLVWSRVFVARRTMANIRINERLRADKGIACGQPQIDIQQSAALQHFQHGFDIVFDLLFANLRKPNQMLPVRHALPGPAFGGVYLWDSAFIALIWRYWDRDAAVDVLRSVVMLRDGDKLQHVVADFVHSEFTQPPLIAWALARNDLHLTLKREELQACFSALTAFNSWLNQHRRLPCGLYYWLHPYESGVENSPRFSSRDEKTISDTRYFAAPDFSSYMVLQCEALAHIAEALERRDEQAHFIHEAGRIRQSMEQWLWHEGDGLYFDWDTRAQRHIRSRTIASLLPLAAGVPTPERACRLCRAIMDENGFGTFVPLPSVARNDPDFEKDMWRGPVWINTAFLVLEGLWRYDCHSEYSEIAWRLCEGVFRVLQREHQVYEFYDPDYFHTTELRRKKGNWWKAFTLGTGPQKDFVGWSGLVNVLVIEALFGVRIAAGKIMIRPGLPRSQAGVRFKLTLPQLALSLSLERTSEHHYRGELVVNAQSDQFILADGEAFFRVLAECPSNA